MNVTTTYKANNYGAGRIIVRGAGHTMTVAYDLAASDPHRVALDAFLERHFSCSPRHAQEIDRYGRGSFPTRRYWQLHRAAF